MINCLTGNVKEIKEQGITLEVSGIGFAVSLARTENFVKSEEVTLHIYMHWNQEQGPALFGFESEFEKTIFLLVTSCSGIGPKIALAVLKNMSPSIFIKAVKTSDEKALSTIPGIGAKKAEHMIVQLRHKVEKLSVDEIRVTEDPTLAKWTTIADVLSSLHYSRPEITAALQHIRESDAQGESYQFDQLLRKALTFLSKRV